MSNQENSLTDLNAMLFETFRAVKEDTMDNERAKTIVGVSNAIVSNAKVQLQAANLLKTSLNKNFFGLEQDDEFPLRLPKGNSRVKDTYNKKLVFAEDLGYKSVSEAISKMGAANFNNEFKEAYNSVGDE